MPGTASLLSTVLLGAVVGAQPPPAEEPADSFVERVDVTAVELMIDVRDPDGLRVRGLGPDDFEVTEDGRPMEILGVDYPPSIYEPEPPPEAAGAPALAAAPSWRTLIFFDLVLTQKRSLRRAVEALGDRADELVAVGPVEVVVANPLPEVVLPFTRDAKALRQALGALRNEPANHQLASIRRDFLNMLDMRLHIASPGPNETAAVLNQIRTSVNREFLLLNRRMITLGQWIGAYGHGPASAAILVSDGFDLDPAAFYLSATSLPGVEAELRLELDRFRVDPLAGALARELAARGWTSVIMALGGTSELATADASMAYRDRFRSIGETGEQTSGPETGSPVSLLPHGLEPLAMISAETGGEMVTARKNAVAALERLPERVRLTYLATRPRDGKLHKVEVKVKSRGLAVRAPEWVQSPTREQIAGARARRLLILDSATGEMPVRLELAGLAAGAEKDTQRATVDIFFDLNLLRAVLPRPKTPMTFTLGVDLPGKPPFVYELIQEIVPPPETGDEAWPSFLYQVALDVPAGARRVAVVVEEPASGVWGGAARELVRR